MSAELSATPGAGSTQAPSPQTEAEYFDSPGLSASGMRDLEVSPLRYWHLHVNPERPKDEPTPALVFGSAVHCAVLQPDAFPDKYACELIAADYPDCLTTADTLKRFIVEHGGKPTGTTKSGWIAQAQAINPDVPILDVLERRHAADNAGKEILSKDFWTRVHGCAESLRQEPEVRHILSQGGAEVPMYAHDPDTGVLLKAKLDWLSPVRTADLKTFSQTRGRSIDQTVADAIWYEKYYRTAYFYSAVRSLADGNRKAPAPQIAPPFILIFVESEEPYEVRIRDLRPKLGGNVNLYWETARIETRHLIRLYANCVRDYGEKPWRSARPVDPSKIAK